MQVTYRFLLASATILFVCGFSACSDKMPQTDEKKGYVLPDSLLKTIEIDTVIHSRVLNSLTLTGKVDFNGDNVI